MPSTHALPDDGLSGVLGPGAPANVLPEGLQKLAAQRASDSTTT